MRTASGVPSLRPPTGARRELHSDGGPCLSATHPATRCIEAERTAPAVSRGSRRHFNALQTARVALAGALLSAVACAHGGEHGGREVVWSGEVRIHGGVEIPAGTTLVVSPGTQVLFEAQDADGDGVGDAAIVAHGEVRAVGREGQEIRFAAAPGNRLGWGEVRVEEGPRAVFRHCTFSGAGSALHAHRTKLEVDRCLFSGNAVGLRFTGGSVSVRRSRFEGNGTAVRYWESAPEIVGNVFRGNDTAIFVREGSRGSWIAGNDFAASRDYHIKLGEAQPGDVAAPDNAWGTTDEAEIERLLFDREDEGYLGRVVRDAGGRRPGGEPPGAAGGRP